jgi:hypothetical protein
VTEMPTREAPPIRLAQVQFGDTIQGLVLRELGDSSLWLDVIVLNDLRPPYIDEQPALGVLAYGDVIKLPAGISAIEAEISPADLYFTDVAVDQQQQLPVAAGDFQLVSGVPNLRAALARRVIVDKRELGFRPEFGCYVRRLLGKSNGPTSGQLAAFYVKSALLEDSRVREVPSCTAEIVGDRISVDATVLAITGESQDVRVII